ncbi:MAG: hypothetical protein C0502_04755 [Opitutus sp.]|nr:hypothetical protein [Opitutus sp.]
MNAKQAKAWEARRSLGKIGYQLANAILGAFVLVAGIILLHLWRGSGRLEWGLTLAIAAVFGLGVFLVSAGFWQRREALYLDYLRCHAAEVNRRSRA